MNFKRADQLIQQLILKSLDQSPNAEIEDFEPLVDMFINFWQFDSFTDMAEKIGEAGIEDPEKLPQFIYRLGNFRSKRNDEGY